MTRETTRELLDSIRLYLSQLNQVANTLQRQLQLEIIDPQLLSNNSTGLAHLLIELLSSIKSHILLDYSPLLNELSTDLSTKKPIQYYRVVDLRTKIIGAYDLTKSITPLYKFINGARAENNPWGIVTQFDRLSRNINQRSRVIIRPRWKHSYSYHPIMDDLVTNANNASYSDESLYLAFQHHLGQVPFYFALAFPPTGDDNILHFALWAHELGHFVDNYQGIRNNRGVIYPDISANYYSSQIAAKVKFDIPEGRHTEILHDLKIPIVGNKRDLVNDYIFIPITNIFGSWAEEIFADTFSFYLFGPAAIFSFVDFVQLNPDNLDFFAIKDYPPYRIRLQILLEQYDDWHEKAKKVIPKDRVSQRYFESMEAEISRLKAMLSKKELQPKFSGNFSSTQQDQIRAFYKILVKVYPQLTLPFKEYVHSLEEKSPGVYFGINDIKVILKQIVDLEKDIPPQFGDVEDYRNKKKLNKKVLAFIFNCGWLYWINQRRSAGFTSKTLLEKENAINNINQLMRKSIDNHEAIYWFTDRSRIAEDYS